MLHIFYTLAEFSVTDYIGYWALQEGDTVSNTTIKCSPNSVTRVQCDTEGFVGIFTIDDNTMTFETDSSIYAVYNDSGLLSWSHNAHWVKIGMLNKIYYKEDSK